MEKTFRKAQFQEIGKELREGGQPSLIPDMPETFQEGELEGQGVLEGLDAAFEKSVAALERSFKESLRVIRKSYKEQMGKVE